MVYHLNSQMCLIVFSEKGLYLINGNLLLLFPSLSNIPSVDKMRPISLTDSFAKIAEGFIAKVGGSGHLHSVDINQFGNIQGVSTAHYLLNFMDVSFQGADKPKDIGTVVLTDFSKAFDLVNHSVAIQKLIHLGVRGTIVPWGCSFLYGRKQ